MEEEPSSFSVSAPLMGNSNADDLFGIFFYFFYLLFLFYFLFCYQLWTSTTELIASASGRKWHRLVPRTIIWQHSRLSEGGDRGDAERRGVGGGRGGQAGGKGERGGDGKGGQVEEEMVLQVDIFFEKKHESAQHCRRFDDQRHRQGTPSRRGQFFPSQVSFFILFTFTYHVDSLIPPRSRVFVLRLRFRISCSH